MAVPPLLRSLLEAFGPSGHEDEASSVWREAASRFASVTNDTLGSTFARVPAAGADGDARSLALVGHIDEIGVTITHVEDNGLLAFANVGGISAEMILGQRLTFHTANGPVPGAVGRKRLAPEQLRERPRLELADLHVDIGARDRTDAESLVQVGDVGVWAGPPLELPNERLLSRALDDRIGAYVVLEAARRIAERGGMGVDVVAVAAVQEEIGLFGARTIAFGLDPLAALVVDVTPSTDYPGGDPRRAGKIELGGGVMIARGPTLNRPLVDLLAAAAREDEIPFAFEVYTESTSTDADELHRARAGIPTGLLSVPTRYVHSPNELCALADIEATVRLIVAFAERLGRETTFLR